MNPFVALPPKARAVIYFVTVFVGVGLGAIQIAYDTIPAHYPIWLQIAGKVLPFLAVAFGLTAASNVDLRASRNLEDPDHPMRVVGVERGDHWGDPDID